MIFIQGNVVETIVCKMSAILIRPPCFNSIFSLPSGDGPENASTNARLSRPELPPIIAKKDTIAYQQLDVDYYIGETML